MYANVVPFDRFIKSLIHYLRFLPTKKSKYIVPFLNAFKVTLIVTTAVPFQKFSSLFHLRGATFTYIKCTYITHVPRNSVTRWQNYLSKFDYLH